MFGFFRSDEGRHKSDVASLFDDFIKPMALVAALAKIIHAYVRDGEKGRISVPAYKRKNASVVEVWRDTRIEVLSPLWMIEGSNVALLADHRRQKELMDCLLDEKPHLESPHKPRGHEVPDTVQAIFQVYGVIQKIGSEVVCMETDRMNLELQKKTIFDEFFSKAENLKEEWLNFENDLKEPKSSNEGDFNLPKTVIEILYEDVTAKTKFIALAAVLGPYYRAGIEFVKNVMRERMEKDGASENEIDEAVQKLRASAQRVLAATDPDHLV